MSLEERVGYGLGSVDIRKKILEEKSISVPFFNEDNVQSSSMELTLSDELFIIDTEVRGIFRQRRDETIYKSLLKLPGGQRKRVNISGGFELKKEFTYLIPVMEKIKLSEGEHGVASQKSSYGRVFIKTRQLTDYNPGFDEVSWHHMPNTELATWLLVQPFAFNAIVYPGMSLNQLRLFKGYAQLNPSEVTDEFSKQPLLYEKRDGQLVPVVPPPHDSLPITMDMLGEATGGVVGLRARNNPEPIDLKKVDAYDPSEFFEPIKTIDGVVTAKRGEHYLFSSSEVLMVPKHLSMEMRPNSANGVQGSLHFAGFIDNGFKGDLVFEVRLDERSDMVITHRMPVSKLDVFRTSIPDKVYKGSYLGQAGPKPPKFFKSFDFDYAAKNYQRLNCNALVQDTKLMRELMCGRTGFEFLRPGVEADISKLVNNGFFHSRYDCESDEDVLQIVPYTVIFGPNNTVFSYLRAEDMDKSSEKKLHGKRSVGVGGHILPEDFPHYVMKCLLRKNSLEVTLTGPTETPQLVGMLLDRTEKVDRVHFGLVFGMYTRGEVKSRDAGLIGGSLMHITDLGQKDVFDRCETWSKLLIPHLKMMYDMVRRGPD